MKGAIIACLCLSLFLAALDGTVVAVSLTTIVAQFGDFSLLSWIIAAYSLSAAISQLLYGKLSDISRPSKMFTVAIVLFAIGSVLSGAAQSMFWLICSRALQGLGGGGIISLTTSYPMADIIQDPAQSRKILGFAECLFYLPCPVC